MLCLEHEIDAGGYRLFVRETGEGPPILFGHSLTFSGLMWSRQVEALASRFRLLLADLPGQGRSGMPDHLFTLDEVAEGLARVLDHLGIERAGYAGHSMGGMAGMRLAIANPERVSALALLNTSGGLEDPDVRALHDKVNERSRGKPSNPKTVDFTLGLMFSPSFMEKNPDVVRAFRAEIENPPDREGLYRAARAVIWRSDVLEKLRALRVPTLVITAEHDTAVAPSHGEALAKTIPGARHVVLPCGHMAPVEEAEAVNRELLEHFSRMAPHVRPSRRGEGPSGA